MNKEYQIDLGMILRLVLMQSKLIIFSSLIFFISSLIIFSSLTKTYKVNSLLQVSSPDSTQIGGTIDFDLMLGGSSVKDINNLVPLYLSRSNVLEVINKLNLNLFIDGLELDESLDIEYLYLNQELIPADKIQLRIRQESFDIIANNFEVTNLMFGELFEDAAIKIKINSANLTKNKIIDITYYDPKDLINLYKDLIKINTSVDRTSFFKSDGLINASIITDNPDQGIKIINLSNSIFIRNNIEIETEKARKAIQFIDNRIDDLASVLNDNKNKLKSFQEKNKSVNVDLEIESVIERIKSIESNIYEIEIELTQSENLYTKSNPIYINLLNQQNALIKQRENIESEIKKLPLAQQQYIDLYREVQISEDLYTELSNRKLTFAIMEASTLGNIRIVDEGYIEDQVGPRLLLVPLITIFGIVITLIIAIIRGLFFMPLSNPAELEDHGINNKILGVLPFLDINIFEPDERFDQSLQSLIYNIISNKKNNKIISVTSATPENGKTFSAMQISYGLSQLGKKVLLIDADYKRGDIHKSLDLEKISYDDFNTISIEDIEHYKSKRGFYVLPRIKRYQNTFEFFYSSSFTNKIELFKKYFDHIVIDTAPILSVSDSALILSISDLKLGVVRHGLTKISQVKQLISYLEQIDEQLDGFIYNSYEKPKSYYGYYGYYGNYSYNYYASKYLYEDYEYKNEK